MKTKLTFTALLLIISMAANSQHFIGIAYTSKFVGKTIDISYERQQNPHGFSAKLLIYTNQPADAVLLLLNATIRSVLFISAYSGMKLMVKIFCTVWRFLSDIIITCEPKQRLCPIYRQLQQCQTSVFAHNSPRTALKL